MDFITKLGIDWKVLLAQIVNFGLLLFILTRFVYKPVCALLEKRKKLAEETVENSRKAETLLADIERVRADALDRVRVQSVEILEKASKEAQESRVQILEEARREAQAVMIQTKSAIEQEKKKMIKEAQTEMSKLILLATSKILEREFSESDQKRLVGDAINHLSK